MQLFVTIFCFYNKKRIDIYTYMIYIVYVNNLSIENNKIIIKIIRCNVINWSSELFKYRNINLHESVLKKLFLNSKKY